MVGKSAKKTTKAAAGKAPPPRVMVRIAPRPPAAAKLPPAPKDTKASEELSRTLLAMLGESQKKAPAPLGMVKCPVCGTPIEPTRNQRIRVHANALETVRQCPASQQRWELFGGAPAPSTKAKPPKKGKKSKKVGRKPETRKPRKASAKANPNPSPRKALRKG